VSDKGPFTIPTIKGRIAERLQGADPRFEEGESEMNFGDSPDQVVLETPEERGVAALACLILENLDEQGGTKAPQRALESVARKTLETFDRKEVMEIEVEAYEILLWLASAIDPSWSRREPEVVREVTPESSNLELIRWAIAGHYDLKMEYYTHGRGELTHRRITPISLEAETYLHAYCHMRRDDRVFRTSRIAEMEPVEEHAPWESEEVDEEDGGEDGEEAGDGDQMNLL